MPTVVKFHTLSGELQQIFISNSKRFFCIMLDGLSEIIQKFGVFIVWNLFLTPNINFIFLQTIVLSGSQFRKSSFIYIFDRENFAQSFSRNSLENAYPLSHTLLRFIPSPYPHPLRYLQQGDMSLVDVNKGNKLSSSPSSG